MSILSPVADNRIVDKMGVLLPTWQVWFNTLFKTAAPASDFGTTANRPKTNLYIGRFYFDTTLGYPVYVKQYSPSIVWVNGAGTVV